MSDSEKKNYDKRSPKGLLNLGFYLIPQVKSQFPKSKNKTKDIFIKYCFDITPLCIYQTDTPIVSLNNLNTSELCLGDLPLNEFTSLDILAHFFFFLLQSGKSYYPS